MDEFERAAGQYRTLVESLSAAEFEGVLDEQTPDPDCRSAQTITRHVLAAGYGHAGYIRRAFGLPATRPEIPLPQLGDMAVELERLCAYVAETLEGRWQMSDEEITRIRFETRWGVTYDVEQMLEHGIVHILRHRRQIARLLGRYDAYVH